MYREFLIVFRNEDEAIFYKTKYGDCFKVSVMDKYMDEEMIFY